MRLGLIIASFVALSVAALTGWTRHVAATPAPIAVPSNYVSTPAPETPPANSTNCIAPAPAGQTYGAPPVYATLPYGASTGETVTGYAASQPAPQYVAPEYVPPAPGYVTNERVIRHEYVAAPVRTRVVYYRRRHRRPFSHSVAIVAGSAAAGAGIGALAGGGRGAGIGALAGGAGGLIYDRLTH